MLIYRNNLPQLNEKMFITDGGMETDLVFHHNIDLPEFASYDLLRNQKGYETLFDYYKSYVELANKYHVGIVLETPTWRANPDWGIKIGDSVETLQAFNRQAVKLIEQVRLEIANPETHVVISGCLGPRGDGYNPSHRMSATEARDYHNVQITTFAETNADMVAALTLNYIEEAIGIAEAAKLNNIPVCISFTLETDGKLPTGQRLKDAIQEVDQATSNWPCYYMINCAHPTHFSHLFNTTEAWVKRIKGLRGNASCLSHEELDNSDTLDEGNPTEFGLQLTSLKAQSPHMTVLGGCCGTDHRHIEQICRNLLQ